MARFFGAGGAAGRVPHFWVRLLILLLILIIISPPSSVGIKSKIKIRIKKNNLEKRNAPWPLSGLSPSATRAVFAQFSATFARRYPCFERESKAFALKNVVYPVGTLVAYVLSG